MREFAGGKIRFETLPPEWPGTGKMQIYELNNAQVAELDMHYLNFSSEQVEKEGIFTQIPTLTNSTEFEAQVGESVMHLFAKHGKTHSDQQQNLIRSTVELFAIFKKQDQFARILTIENVAIAGK